MRVPAYAKINLGLNIVGRRHDGFHEIDTLMLPITLCDDLEIELLPHGYQNLVTADEESLHHNPQNLVYLALELLKKKYQFRESFHVHIKKNIPLAAGLGGGSADAAAIIKTVIELLQLKPHADDIKEICQQIGSDVYFFIANTPCRAQGLGSELTPIKVKCPYHLLLVKGDEQLSTKDVYRLSDQKRGPNCNIDKLIFALENDDFPQLAKEAKNALEPAATNIVPEIVRVKEQLVDLGFELVSLSGSGPTVFALTKNKLLLNKAYLRLKKGKYHVWKSQVIK